MEKLDLNSDEEHHARRFPRGKDSLILEIIE